MNKRRNAAFEADNDLLGFIPIRVPKSIGIADVFAMIVVLWLVGMALHISYNIHIGMKDSKIHIEKQAEIHEWCNDNELARELNFETCKRARVEKDLSMPWTTVNYVLHHTNVCIVTSCYEVLTDISNRLGWLLIGLGLVGSVLLFVILKNNAQIHPMYVKSDSPREIKLIGDGERGTAGRLREVKDD